MLKQQDEFKLNLENINREISQFYTFNKKEQHDENAKRCNFIQEALSLALAESKKFNLRENLF